MLRVIEKAVISAIRSWVVLFSFMIDFAITDSRTCSSGLRGRDGECGGVWLMNTTLTGV